MMQQRRKGFICSCLVAVVVGAAALPAASAAARQRPSSPAAAGPDRLTTVDLVTPGATYGEDFDSLANSGTSSTTPAGWQFAEAGTGGNTTYAAGTGSSTTGDTYSFGSTDATERAFGGLQTGPVAPTVGASFTNLTGGPLAALEIGFTGEQWRLGVVGRVDRLDFQYSLDATSLTSGSWLDFDSLDFTAPLTSGSTGAKDGNLAGNRTVIAATISGLNIGDGAMFWIRWNDLNAFGADDGLAVDDFALTPQSASATDTPTPTSISSAVPTATPIEPSPTPTDSGTPTSTETSTATATATPSSTLTPSSTPSTTPSATFTITPTAPPTATLAPDLDGDGVDDTVEDGAPNAGDGNADAVPDRAQAHVASLPNSATGSYLTLVGPSGSLLAGVAAVANPNPGAPEIAALTFPVGFVQFQLSPMPAAPAAVTVQVLYQTAVISNQYWRYGPEPAPGNTADHWYRFDPIVGSPATGATLISPTRWDLTFVDGGRGDDDLSANGVLVDQGGPGNGGNLPVQLATFTALRIGRATRLEWVTVSEIKTVGFRLWREAPDGRLMPIGPPLIGARGAELSGAAYAFTDWSAPRQRLRYWLDDVATNGRTTRHGPVTVRASRGRPIGPPRPWPVVDSAPPALPVGSVSAELPPSCEPESVMRGLANSKHDYNAAREVESRGSSLYLAPRVRAEVAR
jgi:hypothetical protein